MSRENILQKSESMLVAKKIFVESMNFQRNQVKDGLVRLSQNFVGKNVEMLNQDEYKCSLALKLTDEDQTACLEIVISGIFYLKTDLDPEQKEIIVNKNTMAILFPYMRSQVTLMTSQPDIEPVVIPAININALLQNMEN